MAKRLALSMVLGSMIIMLLVSGQPGIAAPARPFTVALVPGQTTEPFYNTTRGTKAQEIRLT